MHGWIHALVYASMYEWESTVSIRKGLDNTFNGSNRDCYYYGCQKVQINYISYASIYEVDY